MSRSVGRSRASCSNLKAAIGRAHGKRNRGKALSRFRINCTKGGKKRKMK